ncbi:MAG: hypothetical protein JWO39_1525, partial [Gemmatimonadetes bacterium]|nr:hypothetical protein [Gemmatimonadota bacterium]
AMYVVKGAKLEPDETSTLSHGPRGV